MAILLVVLYHAHTGVTGGYVGVDVFFVISGFLITRQLVRELMAKGTISFSGFYARRARRILPAATLTTIVTVVAAGLLLSPLPARRVFDDARAAALFGANIHFAAQDADYFNDNLTPSPVQHYWSLSVEEQFYFVWPLLLVVSSFAWVGLRGRRKRSRRESSIEGSNAKRRARIRMVVLALGVVAMGSFFLSVSQTPGNPSWAYFSIFTRGWELAAGALVALSLPLAERLDRRLAVPLAWLGMACIAAAAVTFNASTPYPGDDALLPVAGAVAIIIAGSSAAHRWGAEALLGTPPFQRVGAWSYSWYLWHWPVLILAPALLGHSLAEPEALAMAALSLVIAVLSFVLVERPIRRMQVLVRRPAVGLAGGAALVASSIIAVTVSGALASIQTGPAVAAPAVSAAHVLTPEQLAKDLRTAVRTRRVPSNLNPALTKAADAKPSIVLNGCSLQDAGVKSKPCIYGDRKSSTSVVLFGDSHATTWFPALNLISKRQHWRLVDLTKAGCPTAEVRVSRKGGWYNNCTAWRHNSERLIAAQHPALVVMAEARYGNAAPLRGVRTGYGSTWLNGVAATFRFLHGSASHAVFMSDVPRFPQSVPDCVSGHASDIRRCTITRRAAEYDPAARAGEFRLANQFQIKAVDPIPWFCAPVRCPVIVGNILLFRDTEHMVPAWSRFLAPVLADELLPTMRSPASAKAKS